MALVSSTNDRKSDVPMFLGLSLNSDQSKIAFNEYALIDQRKPTSTKDQYFTHCSPRNEHISQISRM